MTAFQRLLGRIAGRFRLSKVLVRFHDGSRRHVLCLGYHRVMPIPDDRSYPFDLELISASPENFDQQMRYIAREFDPIPLTELVVCLESGRALPRRPVVVTFDDGYDDNLRYAGPILKQHGIVPTIYLATDQVGTSVPYWFELAVYLMMKVPPKSIVGPGLNEALPPSDDRKSRRASAARLLEILKYLPHAEMMRLISTWLEQHRDVVDPSEFVLSRVLDWDTVRQMDGKGFEFGSHSRRHPVLANLSESDLRDELIGSRQRLREELGHDVKTVAYPVGKEFAFSPLVKRIAAEAGYSLAMSYVAGPNWLSNDVDLFALRRQSVERLQDLGRFEALTQFPAWVQW